MNTDVNKIELPFEGWTYLFPRSYQVSIEEEKGLKEFLEERFPLAFKFIEKEKAPPVKKFKTKSYYPSIEKVEGLGKEDMRIEPVHPKATFGSPDALPESGKIDKEGVEWYGEGVQQDG